MQSGPKSKYRFKILTGHTALAVNGVPAEFAAQCMIILSKYNITAAWRVGDHADPDKATTEKKRLTIDIASHPKPYDVKEKSSNWGFTKWFIADNPLLGKYDDQGKPMNIGAKRSERVSPTPHFVTLRFILNELNKSPASMRLDAITDDNELLITCLDAPQGAPSSYRIKLNNGVRGADVNPEALMVVPDSAKSRPGWWPKQLHFGDSLDQRFPVEYKNQANDQYEPVKVLGIRDARTNEVVPIITDMDLLWVSNPDHTNPFIRQCLRKNIPVFAVMDCNDKHQRKYLLAALHAMHAIDNILYAKDNPEMLDNLDVKRITDETLSRMGCVTPFTAYFILLANQRFAHFVEHLEDLMQHSAEIFNPYKPSALGATLNIAGGEVAETFCEEDQIEYTLELINRGYSINPHPQWDMSKWGCVVQKMLDRGDLIAPDVRLAYNMHLEKQDKRSDSAVTPLLLKFSRTLSQTTAAIFARRPSAELTTPIRKDSTGVFIVQTRCPDINIHDDKSSLLGKTKTERMKNFCHDSTQHHEHERWHHQDHNTVMLTTVNPDQEPKIYTFKIDAMKISLVSGEVNHESIGALKKLSELMFGNQKVQILAASDQIMEMTEKFFSPPKSPRPN